MCVSKLQNVLLSIRSVCSDSVLDDILRWVTCPTVIKACCLIKSVSKLVHLRLLNFYWGKDFLILFEFSLKKFFYLLYQCLFRHYYDLLRFMIQLIRKGKSVASLGWAFKFEAGIMWFFIKYLSFRLRLGRLNNYLA